jgi:demethylspheroidene O-methyltransferase
MDVSLPSARERESAEGRAGDGQCDLQQRRSPAKAGAQEADRPDPSLGRGTSRTKPAGSLSFRFRLWRNRLIGSARFQAWASRFPLTRPVARREARALFDLTAGFVYAQTAAALVESGLLDALAERPLATSEAAKVAGLPEPATVTLLKAAASLQLTERIGPHWTLGVRGAALAATPGLPDMIRHHRLFYADLADPLAMLRGDGPGRLAALWRYDGSADPDAVGTYSRLMAATQPMVAAQALAAYDFRRHRRLLDIGGGEGAFLAAVGARAPDLELGLLDLPAVTARVTPRPRLALHPGSFLMDAFPSGYDLHSLVRVLHDHDDAPATRILAASRAALPAGGRLLVVEPMAAAGSAPEGHGYFGLYLAAMHSGRPREVREIKDMLRAAGFRGSRMLRTPLPMVARCILAST